MLLFTLAKGDLVFFGLFEADIHSGAQC